MNFFKKSTKNDNMYDDEAFYDDDYYGTHPKDSDFDMNGEETVTETSGVAFSGGASPVAMKVIKPKGYDDGPEIADFLASGSTVILNVELLDKNATKRILDFLLGATHVLGGTMNMVARGTFVFAPRSVGVSDMTEEAEEAEGADEAAE